MKGKTDTIAVDTNLRTNVGAKVVVDTINTNKGLSTKDTATKPKFLFKHLSIGMDLFYPTLSKFVNYQEGYEFAVDYYMKHDLYAVLEGGFGSSFVAYPDLQYQTHNIFIRFGVNRSLLLKQDSTDWNNMFIGLRFGGADVRHSSTNYTVLDSVWGNVPGSLGGKEFMAYWVEMNMGTRVQILRNISVGWTIRAKFILNGKSFQELSPVYIAGYGRGDKNSTFDFNFYLWYGINWKVKNRMQAVKKT